jgi:hypothetical protein
MAINTNDAAYCGNGGAVGTDATVTLQTHFKISLSYATAYLPNGHVQEIMYLPRRMTNGELQTLTTL